MAKRERELSRQKLPDEGLPITCLSFQGDMKARACISRSEATSFHPRQTQAARARSESCRRSKMQRRMSREARAEKLEFMGEMMMVLPWASGFASIVVMDIELV